MSKRKIIAPIVTLLLVLSVVAGLVSTAAAMESTNYAINWDVFGGGGEPSASTHYALDGTVGQWSIGTKSSATYRICSGYWCGAAEYAIYLPIILRDVTS